VGRWEVGTQGTQAGETFILREIAGFVLGYLFFLAFFRLGIGERNRKRIAPATVFFAESIDDEADLLEAGVTRESLVDGAVDEGPEFGFAGRVSGVGRDEDDFCAPWGARRGAFARLLGAFSGGWVRSARRIQ